MRCSCLALAARVVRGRSLRSLSAKRTRRNSGSAVRDPQKQQVARLQQGPLEWKTRASEHPSPLSGFLN
jgi:hypothetical protein